MKEFIEQIKETNTLIFDMDGTLVDLENLNYTSFKKVVEEELGISYTQEDYQTYMSGAGSHNGFNSFCNAKGITTDVEELITKFRGYKREILKSRFFEVVKLKEGAVEFLNKAKEKGYKLGLATSSADEFAKLVTKNFKIYDMFSVFLTAKDIEKNKPDPEIFNKAIMLLNSEKDKTIVFEDSKNGILAAKRSGMYTVGVHTPGLNDNYVKDTNYVIKSYFEIIDLI